MEADPTEQDLRKKIWNHIPKIREKGRQEEARSEWKEEWSTICRYKYSIVELEQLVGIYATARAAWDKNQARILAKRREKTDQ